MTDSQDELHSDLPGPRVEPQLIPARLLHDLRTPLNQIIGYSEILRDQAVQQSQDDLAADTGRIRSAGKQLLSIIETHFQAASGKGSTPAAPIDGDADSGVADFSTEVILENSGDAASGSRILIVDDSKSNRDILARQMDRENFRVTMAGNGHEALEKMRAHSFDTVLLDIMMPDMDGYEVLRRMKADDALRPIPVIMISALNEMNSVVRCIEMGAEDYLPKPFNPTLLRARIGACLDKKHAHDREARLLAEVRENYAQLRRIEQQRDELMNMIVHDLRTPLASNIAGIEMVQMLGPVAQNQRDCLKIAMRSGQNLLELINDLLDIAKMEAGALQLELQSCNAAYLAAVAADQISPLLADKSLQLTRDIAPDLRALKADENKLRRIFVNLLSNAVKFTPREGHITFSVRQEKEFVLFAVQDTGEGIPETALTDIFEKYSQVGNRKSGHRNSTGLGLTYCKMAVEAHGGRIWAQSTPGVGSTFFFTIPTVP